MNTRFSSSSGIARVASVLAATVITVTLFGAVAFGLTSTDGWSLLAQDARPVRVAAA
jgi:hypothetical protein